MTDKGKNVKLTGIVHPSAFIDVETFGNDLLAFGLSLNYPPGMDLPSKRVLNPNQYRYHCAVSV
jgi:hypothetical protein